MIILLHCRGRAPYTIGTLDVWYRGSLSRSFTCRPRAQQRSCRITGNQTHVSQLQCICRAQQLSDQRLQSRAWLCVVQTCTRSAVPALAADLRLSSLEREALAAFGPRESPSTYQLLPDQRPLPGDAPQVGPGHCSTAPPHQQRPQLALGLERSPSRSLSGEAAGAALASLKQEECQHQQAARASLLAGAGAGAPAGSGVVAGASLLPGPAREQQLMLAPPQAEVGAPQTEPRASSRSHLRGEGGLAAAAGQGQPKAQAAVTGRRLQQQQALDQEPGDSHGAVLHGISGEAAEGSDEDDVTGAAKPPAGEPQHAQSCLGGPG